MTKHQIEDINDLIRKIGKGNSDSLGELYGLYGGYLFVIALDYVKRVEIAEELMQNALLIIAEKSSSFKFGNGKSWMIKIIKNLSIDYLRKHSKENTDIEKIYDLPINNDLCEDYTASSELTETLKNLTEDEYSIIVKLYYEDLSIKEIARELHIKQDTVYKIHTRALNRLNKILSGGKVL